MAILFLLFLKVLVEKDTGNVFRRAVCHIGEYCGKRRKLLFKKN